jgi:hypothetical protein
MAERKAFLLRIDPAVMRQVESVAAEELRSVNAQIEFLLREALRKRGIRPAAPKPGEDTKQDG